MYMYICNKLKKFTLKWLTNFIIIIIVIIIII